MARRITQPYRCPPLAQLTPQLLFAPPAKRAEQVRRAEKLHDQIDPAIDYPFEFISYRITSYRSETEHPTLLKGADIQPDLRLLIDALSRSTPMPGPAGETMETPDEISRRLNVSIKTIQRWRAQGLRWCWVACGRNRNHLVIARSVVDRFLSQEPHRLDRAASYSHLSEPEKEIILRRAQRLAQRTTASLNQIATHLAKRSGRAAQTVRQMLADHDRHHPRKAMFPGRTGPLSAEDRKAIAREHKAGVPLRELVRRYRRTPATILRTVHQRRASALRSLRIAYVASPTFARPDAEQVFLHAELPDSPRIKGVDPLASAIADLPEAVRGFFQSPTLSPRRLRSLAARYNFLKFRAAEGLRQLDRFAPRVADLDRIEDALRRAGQVRAELASAGLRVVLPVAMRHMVDQPGHPQHALLDLLEQGASAACAAVEDYDMSRGQTFEAHLTWMLMRHYAGHAPDATRARRRLDPATLAATLASTLSPQRWTPAPEN